MYKLAAIWLNKPVIMGDGRSTRRLTTGDMICVENDELVDCGSSTHQVTALRGGISRIDGDFIAICSEHYTNDVYELKL